jgi:hypothetical protein
LSKWLKEGRIVVAEVPVPHLAEGNVLVRNAASLVSAGTQLLQTQGFRTSGLLIPILQAFGNCDRGPDPRNSCKVVPRQQDIVAQAKAWTDGGAVTIMFFTWQSSDSDEKYLNTASIWDGVQQAAAYFRAR